MTPDDTLDMLAGRTDRVREVSAVVAMDGPLKPEKIEEIRRAATRYIKRAGYAQGAVAQKVASNETYISNFLSGRFDAIPAATLQKLARRINEWIELDHRRRRHGGGRRVFVHTRVAERLIKVARHAVETCDIVVAHGPAGCGKTATLEQLVDLIPASIYLYITPERAKRGGFLRALYEAVWEHRSPRRPTLEDVLDRLRHSDRLLMLDNADELTTEVDRILMALHDVARVPILLVGTQFLLRRLTHDNDPLRGQMSSRIGLRAELLSERTSPRRRGRAKDWITADQIRAIFGTALKLHADAVARLKAIANAEIGHLRRCERYLRYAALIARGGQITLDVLDRAIELVDGQRPAPLPAAGLEAATA